MQDNDHEWDDEKASANLLKHGVSFEIATGVFKIPLHWNFSMIAGNTTKRD